MIKSLLPVFLILLFNLGNADESKDLYLPADPLKGAIHFTEKGCEKCHSIEGRGGHFGPDLARADLNGSLLDIVSLMWNHSPQMTGMMSDLKVGRPQFTGTEIAELASYIFFLAYFDKPGDIAEGRKVFSRKGCSNCHRVGGIGTRVGPSLAFIKKYVSPIFLSQLMWNHGPSIHEKMTELNVSWPEFEGGEISDLLAFLRDASPDTTSVRIFMRPGNPQIGESLFQKKKCTTCHQVLNVGTKIGPDLTQTTFHKSVTSVAAVMWNHGPAIWDRIEEVGLEIPTFEDNELADLIAYLYFIRFFEKSANRDRGEMLFEQKGCRNCHHFGEASVEESFSLSGTNASLSKLDIVANLWNHAGDMATAMTGKRVEWPRLSKGEMNHLLEYILSHRK